MGGIIKKYIRILSVALTLSIAVSASRAFAAPVRESHFLYPVDQAFLSMDAFEDTVSPYRTKVAMKNCAAGHADAKDLEICDLAKPIQNSHFPLEKIPWEKLTAQILFFGEVHLDQDIKKFLEAHMDQLQSIGVNALGLEMLNSVSQPLIDSYLKDEASIDDVRRVLEHDWNYQSDGYLRVIEAAKKRGFKVLALDERPDDLYKLAFFDQIHQRDRHMAETLASAISARPELKVAVLCGRLHSYKNYSVEGLTDSLPSLLRKKYGLSTQTILTFSHWDKTAPNSLYMALYGEFTQGFSVFPELHPYTDFILFLRPTEPAPEPPQAGLPEHL